MKLVLPLPHVKPQKGNKMDITNAEFVISNTDVRKCPAGTFPEYAFIGRSNVGKLQSYQYADRKERTRHDLCHTGKDHAYQPFPNQQELVHCRPSGMMLRPNGDRKVKETNQT